MIPSKRPLAKMPAPFRQPLLLFLGAILVLAMTTLTSTAAPVDRGEVTTGPSGLPLPRFVSLSASVANMRTGPGQRFPILWVYKRQGLPLEVTAEYGPWRRVRDHEGTQGWMHARLLSGTRTVIVDAKPVTSRHKPEDDAPPVLILQPGVTAEITQCRQGAWCRIILGGRKSWVRRAQIWGTYRAEIID